MISTPLLLLISQAQPAQKRPVAAAPNFSLNVSKLPNAELIAAPTLPDGLPPALGARICQNMEWLIWPPPLLRTAVLMASGTMAQLFASNSSTVLLCRSGADSSALFKFVTYAP